MRYLQEAERETGHGRTPAGFLRDIWPESRHSCAIIWIQTTSLSASEDSVSTRIVERDGKGVGACGVSFREWSPETVKMWCRNFVQLLCFKKKKSMKDTYLNIDLRPKITIFLLIFLGAMSLWVGRYMLNVTLSVNFSWVFWQKGSMCTLICRWTSVVHC